MGHLARALASLFTDRRETHDRAHSEQANEQQGGCYEHLGQRAQDHAGAPPSHAAASGPSKKEVLDYLGRVAQEYKLPSKLVYSVANAESSLDPNKEHRNPPQKDKHGKVMHPGSTDYGLMQINDRTWFGKPVKDASGHSFKIDENVKTGWRANARAGVAILTRQYDLAALEQGPGATEEDHAQQAYSGCSHGEKRRDLYLREGRDGLPANGKDRNFLQKYRRGLD